MSEPVWLTVDIACTLHAESLVSFGGAAGLRDPGLLESALDRPRSRFAHGEAPALFELAAAHCAGIVRNHPFIDGNKRAGALAAAVFLELNDIAFAPNEAELVIMILDLAAGEVEDAELAAWIERNSAAKPGG